MTVAMPLRAGSTQRGRITLAFSPAPGPAEQLARGALMALLRHWQSEFAESLHVMAFPREQGFSSDDPLQRGDVFQRAVIADALCDADDLLGGQLSRVIAAETEYLIGCRRPDGVGGWSYFPSLRELSPDADDLAQMILLFVRIGREQELRALCEPPLEVLLRDGTHADGAIDTWIIPRENRTADQELQALWAQKAWGRTADVEVIGNLLHALRAWDVGKFADVIARGTRFIESRQERDGSWRSSWYRSDLYGTWTSLRLLPRESEAVRRAVSYIEASRWDDDPLEASLAVLGAAAAGAMTDAMAARALDALRALRSPDGSWPSTPLIRMDMGRAAGKVHCTLYYGSSCMTTAYALKALLVLAQRERIGAVS